MATTSGRTVFVLGKHSHGNRQVLILESGTEYTLDPAAIETYAQDVKTRFPYEL